MIIEVGKGLKATDAYIRIEKDRCILSSRACFILQWSRVEPYIVVAQDSGNGQFFIRHSNKRHGYLVRRKQKRGIINSRDLSRKLVQSLGSLGSFRICEENYKIDEFVSYRIDDKPSEQE